MNTIQTDFLVIGSGLAGLTFALEAAEHGSVTVVTKAELFETNTSYAQGGIAAAVGESDSWQLHEEDTLRAGAGECDPVAVRFLVQQAPDAIEWLNRIGVRFDRNGTDQLTKDYDLGLEGGHSRNRILHHADKTGWEVERAMNAAVKAHPRITIHENTFVTSLLVQEGSCYGVQAILGDERNVQFHSNATLLATGGVGRLYQYSTNPRIATADGIGLGHRGGALISDMEFMQFHPTSLYHPQLRNYLITEATRGAGATLRNHLGERFMYSYDDRLELAPRDVVARAIINELKNLDTWCVYLDLTHLEKKSIEEEFPSICQKLAGVGIYPHKDWVPIIPAQHYSCGGINTDCRGRTNLTGLFAAGEVARTGVHGANRLASNSLLEALVFARSAASAAQQDRSKGSWKNDEIPVLCMSESDAVRVRKSIQKIMTDEVGIIRTTAGLREAKARIDELLAEAVKLETAPFSAYAAEARNLLDTASYIINGAINRTRNVGLHYNADLVGEK